MCDYLTFFLNYFGYHFGPHGTSTLAKRKIAACAANYIDASTSAPTTTFTKVFIALRTLLCLYSRSVINCLGKVLKPASAPILWRSGSATRLCWTTSSPGSGRGGVGTAGRANLSLHLSSFSHRAHRLGQPNPWWRTPTFEAHCSWFFTVATVFFLRYSRHFLVMIPPKY